MGVINNLYLNKSQFESHNSQVQPEFEERMQVRLDKWLWAARFYKTRALAREAVDKGKVIARSVQGIGGETRIKPSLEINIGDVLCIKCGAQNKVVQVIGLSTRRRGNDEAEELYKVLALDDHQRSSSIYKRLLGKRPPRNLHNTHNPNSYNNNYQDYAQSPNEDWERHGNYAGQQYYPANRKRNYYQARPNRNAEQRPNYQLVDNDYLVT